MSLEHRKIKTSRDERWNEGMLSAGLEPCGATWALGRSLASIFAQGTNWCRACVNSSNLGPGRSELTKSPGEVNLWGWTPRILWGVDQCQERRHWRLGFGKRGRSSCSRKAGEGESQGRGSAMQSGWMEAGSRKQLVGELRLRYSKGLRSQTGSAFKF